MNPNSVVTTVKKREEYFVQFTPEEMKTLNLEGGDRFDVSVDAKGAVVLRKMPGIELDLEDFSKPTLESLIKLSIEKQVPVDDVIRELLEGYLASRGEFREE